LRNGVSLNKLMNSLEADSFAPTQRNLRKGDGNQNPRLSYKRKPGVELSKEAFFWLSQKFDEAIGAFGSIPEHELSQLDWPDTYYENLKFELTLGKTYFEKGYFNLPRPHAHHVTGGELTIILGKDRQIVQGMSQIYEANNYVPRVFGYENLRTWFLENYSLNDTVEVFIEAQNEIWIK